MKLSVMWMESKEGEGDSEDEGEEEASLRAAAAEEGDELRSLWFCRSRAAKYGARRWISDLDMSFVCCCVSLQRIIQRSVFNSSVLFRFLSGCFFDMGMKFQQQVWKGLCLPSNLAHPHQLIFVNFSYHPLLFF